MGSRSRQDFHQPIEWSYSQPANKPLSPVGTWSPLKFDESIVWTKKGRRVVNSCVHYRRDYTWTPWTMTGTLLNGTSFRSVNSHMGYSISNPSWPAGHHLPFLQLSYADLRNKIVNPMGNNASVFLAELADVKSAWNQLRSWPLAARDALKTLGNPNAKQLGALISSARRNPAQFAGRHLRGLSRTAANEYLGILFGLLPLAADLERYATALMTLDEAKSSYDALDGKGVYTKYNDVQNYSNSGKIVEVKGRLEFTTSYKFQMKLVAGAWVSYTSTNSNPTAFASDYLGLGLNLSDAWELVPMSFALDWFVDVGSVIDDLDVTAQHPTLDTKLVSTSRKVEGSGTIKCSNVLTSAYRGDPEKGHTLASFTFRHYNRKPGKIAFVTRPRLGPGISGFGRAVTAAALARSRFN